MYVLAVKVVEVAGKIVEVVYDWAVYIDVVVCIAGEDVEVAVSVVLVVAVVAV